MDISNIRIVAQWKATCSLSTIWQHWGRAARDRGLQGTVILFAEKEYFDDVREEKRQRQEAQKRKATKPLTVQTPASKRQLCNSGTIVAGRPQGMPLDGSLLDVEVSGDEDESDLSGGEGKATMTDHTVRVSKADGSKGAGKVIGNKEWREMVQLTGSKLDRKHPRPWRKRKELDPAMDCLINAHLRAGLHCRRKVFDLHFDNASAGEKASIILHTETYRLFLCRY